MKETLLKWKEYYEEVAGNWNGEDTQGEDSATIALDIIEHIDGILELIEDEYPETPKVETKIAGVDFSQNLQDLKNL
jgi:hypothetical protein